MDKKLNSAINKMNDLGKKRKAFLFIFDYEMQCPVVLNEAEITESNISFRIQSNLNEGLDKNSPQEKLNLKIKALPKESYKEAFNLVMDHINHGNSYLLNLTFPSGISISRSLAEIYHSANAKYKLLFGDKFVVFSPESFVKIQANKIFSFPMKGTIDASIPNAKKILEINEYNELSYQ